MFQKNVFSWNKRIKIDRVDIPTLISGDKNWCPTKLQYLMILKINISNLAQELCKVYNSFLQLLSFVLIWCD